LNLKENFVERRSGKDRRKTPRSAIRSIIRGGKRERARRQEDRNEILWVDRYSQTLFGAIVLILFFSVLDGLLTLFLIGHDAEEINPIMAYYLNVSPYVFFSVKYFLTSVAVIVLLLCQNIFLRTIRIHTHTLFYVFVAAFVAVVAWEVFLIFQVLT
jgi:hypothetical protein